MHRAKSLQFFSRPSSQSSEAKERLDSKLDINDAVPYNNAKLRGSPRSRLMPCWTQAALQRLGSVLQLLLLLLAVCLWGLHIQARHQAAQPRHLVVLDAGSTGTRVHVFQYAADSSSSYASLLLPEPKLKVQPGLSAYADNAPGAAASLHPLLQFASQHIPASQVPQTPVYLMATAGLRLLPTAAADSILKECRSTLLASDFLFEPDWAQVISGTYEGLYAWVAANYAAGHLQAAAEDAAHSRKDLHSAQPTFKALLEMGGASAQVTFMPDAHWHQHSTGSSKQRVRVKLPGVNHPLWSHSYLGYGFDVVQIKVQNLVKQLALTATTSDAPLPPAHLAAAVVAGQRNMTGTVAAAEVEQQAAADDSSTQLVQAPAAVHVDGQGVIDPCLPAGYESDNGHVGSGVWQQCQQLVEAVIDPAACRPVLATPCPELPDSMPKLTGDLLAIENFAYTAQALSLPAVSSLGEFAAAARQFCSRPWPQTLQAHSQEPEQQQYLWRYCFGSAFAWTLLHHVLRIGEGQQLHFTNVLQRKVGGPELGLDWALGAAVLQLANNSAAEGARLEQLRYKGQLLLFAAVAATVVLAVCTAATVQADWRAGRLSPNPAWLTVVMLSGGGSADAGGGTDSSAPDSWSSMASSAWANSANKSSVKQGYNLVPQQVRL